MNSWEEDWEDQLVDATTARRERVIIPSVIQYDDDDDDDFDWDDDY